MYFYFYMVLEVDEGSSWLDVIPEYTTYITLKYWHIGTVERTSHVLYL